MNNIRDLSMDEITAYQRNRIGEFKYIYFLFYEDALVYIGKTIQHPIVRVLDHKQDKFFTHYSFTTLDAEHDLDATESFLIKKYNPIYNIDGIQERQDKYLLWSHGIVVDPGGRNVGGNKCLKVLSSNIMVNPKGEEIGYLMREYNKPMFFKENYRQVMEDAFKINKDKEKSWIASECRSITAAFIRQFALKKHPGILGIEVDDWLDHVAYYCSLRGCIKSYLEKCLSKSLGEFFSHDHLISKRCRVMYKDKIQEAAGVKYNPFP